MTKLGIMRQQPPGDVPGHPHPLDSGSLHIAEVSRGLPPSDVHDIFVLEAQLCHFGGNSSPKRVTSNLALAVIDLVTEQHLQVPVEVGASVPSPTSGPKKRRGFR